MFGVERVGAKRVCACTSIESGVEGKVERIPGWNMEGTRFQFKQDESSVGHPPATCLCLGASGMNTRLLQYLQALALLCQSSPSRRCVGDALGCVTISHPARFARLHILLFSVASIIRRQHMHSFMHFFILTSQQVMGPLRL